jgi:hypothetical protein
MTTITIEVTEEMARQLTEEAKSLNVTPEDLAARRLIETMGQSKPDFHQIARQVIDENAELYRRLA